MTPCIEYKGNIHSGTGYGQAGHAEYGTRSIPRIVWIRAHGPIPRGLLVRHKCDNRKCMRLSHLCLGTHKQNAEDRMKRGRHRSGFTLSVEVRAAIWRSSQRGPMNGSEIARKLGVNQSTINRIRRGEIGHV